MVHDTDIPTNDGGSTSMDTTWKLVAIFLIYLVGIVFAVFPIVLRTKFAASPSYTTGRGMANSFAAGIFLSMGLIHLLPEGAAKFNEHYGEESDSKYHLCYLMCIVGYTCILTLERVVFTTPTCAHHMQLPYGQLPTISSGIEVDKEGGQANVRTYNMQVHADEDDERTPSFLGEHNALLKESQSEHAASVRSMNRGTAGCDAEGSHLVLRSSERIVAALERSASQSYPDDHGHSHTEAAGHGQAYGTITKGDEHSHAHGGAEEAEAKATLAPYVLMAALGAHGLSEGLALGVETGTRGILLLLFSILAHKWAEGLALGISFSKSTVPTSRILMLLSAFSLSTPVGVDIGWLAQALLPDYAEGYFLGFSAGSFLYIGASEVVVEEFIQGKRQWGKLLSLIVGITLIWCVTAFVDFG